MLLILACEGDVSAASVARAAGDRAWLCTPRELHQEGWTLDLQDPARCSAVIAGRRTSVTELSGVLVRLPWVAPEMLPMVREEDRSFVAAEWSAFLLGWLSAIPARVVPRPTETCLAGPALLPECWSALAARLGLAVRPSLRCAGDVDAAPHAEAPRTSVVTVVGSRCYDHRTEAEAAAALGLARAVDAELLAVHFAAEGSEPVFVGASVWPSLERAELVGAVLAEFPRLR